MVTVDDMRGTAAGWSVTLSGGDFIPNPLTSSPNAAPFDIENLSLDAQDPEIASDVSQPAANLTGQSASDLSQVTNVAQTIWTASNGNGEGKFNLDLVGDLKIPGGTLVGNYSSTVTVTLGAAPVVSNP